MHKTFTPGQKAQIATAVLKGQQSVAQIASENAVHPTQVNQWTKIDREGLPLLFTDKRKDEFKELRDKIDQLYKIIGQRDSELDWLKKNCTLTHREKLSLLDREHAISLTRQCELLNISRASAYYQPVVKEKDIAIMGLVDKIFTDYPFYGSRRIRHELNQTYKILIARDHVRRLFQVMGIEAIYPKSKPNTSEPHLHHRTYPYLLKGLPITRSNQIWGTDITYVKLENGSRVSRGPH